MLQVVLPTDESGPVVAFPGSFEPAHGEVEVTELVAPGTEHRHMLAVQVSVRRDRDVARVGVLPHHHHATAVPDEFQALANRGGVSGRLDDEVGASSLSLIHRP